MKSVSCRPLRRVQIPENASTSPTLASNFREHLLLFLVLPFKMATIVHYMDMEKWLI
jgi:hypothetical protein